ncbi:MAG TPA: quinolinate synthase NadA [Bacteroidales bacterium]|nr:quinolinate synthase NadA [Bacteroidales bacterium]HPO65043.1 quinolinate synthase NadA [Bacteroidales bacterium]
MNNKELLIEKINRLRKEKNAVIMAHYYQIPEIQDIADFIGDSLALAQQALKVKADVIVLAGVYFMAETAKILNPEKKVIIPDPLAGCSLADSCPVDSFSEFRSRYPDAIVVSYVNTSAEIKALTDIVCTSSNAEQIINAIPKDKQIIFAPDRNLGNYLAAKTGRNLIIWDGACHVHEDFSLERILELKKQNPDAKIIAHPECKKPILIIADHVGSTSSLLAYVQKDSGRKYIVATESGIIHQMKAACPDKVFIPAPPTDSTCGCNDCRFMKLITLDKIYRSLETLSPEVIVDEQIRVKAEKSIKAMLDITAGKPVFSTL